MLEVDMVDMCYNYLIKSNSYTKLVREVPFLSRCIDLAMITKENETITIEFKMKDWRHALEQVKSHKLGADKAYICLPVKKPSKILENALIEESVGLYLYLPEENNPMYEYMPAPKNEDRVEAFSTVLQNKIDHIASNYI